MAILRTSDIIGMGEEERSKKIKELKLELIKAKLANKKSVNASPREIRKTIARLISVKKPTKEAKK